MSDPTRPRLVDKSFADIDAALDATSGLHAFVERPTHPDATDGTIIASINTAFDTWLREHALTEWASRREMLRSAFMAGLAVRDEGGAVSCNFSAAQIDQIMNALEGWESISLEEDEARRKAAFEMIQAAHEPAAAASKREPSALVVKMRRVVPFLVHPPSCPLGVGLGYYVPRVDARCECGIADLLALLPPEEDQP